MRYRAAPARLLRAHPVGRADAELLHPAVHAGQPAAGAARPDAQQALPGGAASRCSPRSGSSRTRTSFVQYLDYLGNMLTGQLGHLDRRAPSASRCARSSARRCRGRSAWSASPPSWRSSLGSLIGIVAGWRRGGKLDSILPPVFVVTSALPYFWVGLLLILVLLGVDQRLAAERLQLRHRPAARVVAGRSSRTSLQHAILPARDDPHHLDRRLGADHAQQHDHHAGRGLRADGTGEGPVRTAGS